MTAIIPSDELDAVNVLLESIGEAPVNSLTGTVIDDVAIARNKISQVSRGLQSTGWGFNTEIDYPLLRSTDAETLNQILLPANAIRLKVFDTASNPTQRGARMYNRKLFSYVFTTDLEATEMVIILPFNELPEQARQYITLTASRLYSDNSTQDAAGGTRMARDEMIALSALMDYEADTEGSSIFDNYELSQVIRRLGPSV
jgi:hypothetical protein